MAGGSKSDVFENALLEFIFLNTPIEGVGDASGLLGSFSEGDLYVALYTTAPTDSQAGVEANYTGYQRVAVPRTSAGWTVTGNAAENTAEIAFPECSGGNNTIQGVGVMSAAAGGIMLYWDQLDSPLNVSAGISPVIAEGDLIITED